MDKASIEYFEKYINNLKDTGDQQIVIEVLSQLYTIMTQVEYSASRMIKICQALTDETNQHVWNIVLYILMRVFNYLPAEKAKDAQNDLFKFFLQRCKTAS